jgi:hypothetical protein
LGEGRKGSDTDEMCGAVLWRHGSGWRRSREEEDDVHREIHMTEITEAEHDEQNKQKWHSHQLRRSCGAENSRSVVSFSLFASI